MVKHWSGTCFMQHPVKHWSGTCFMQHPHLQSITIASDASSTIGGGGYLSSGEWFYMPWASHHQREGHKFVAAQDSTLYHITALELMMVIYTIALHGHLFRGHSVTVLCDNTAAVACIHSRTSNIPEILSLLRFLTEVEVRFDIIVLCEYIPGPENIIADAISRNNMIIARQAEPNLASSPTPTSTLVQEYEAMLAQY